MLKIAQSLGFHTVLDLTQSLGTVVIYLLIFLYMVYCIKGATNLVEHHSTIIITKIKDRIYFGDNI